MIFIQESLRLPSHLQKSPKIQFDRQILMQPMNQFRLNLNSKISLNLKKNPESLRQFQQIHFPKVDPDYETTLN